MEEENKERLELLERNCDRAATLQRLGRAPKDNWITWGESLLGIADCQKSLYSKRLFIHDAIKKLRLALSKDKRNAHANWCMGNAYVAYGLVSPDYRLAQNHFLRASKFFKRAVSLDPGNEKYVDSLDLPKEAASGPDGIYVAEGPAGFPLFNDDGTPSIKGWLTVGAIVSTIALFAYLEATFGDCEEVIVD